MSFYIQHGYGKSRKIQALAETGDLAGVTLSPADEDADSLLATAELCRSLGLDVRIDPQTFVYTTAPSGSGKHHQSHGIDFPGIHWSQDAKTTELQVSAVGRMNTLINPLGGWVAPSVLQSSFTDVWTPVALQMARTAADSWGPNRTIASLVIEESALSTWDSIEDWLDVATTLDVKGFYILVARGNSSYPPVGWSSERLKNLLRLIYNLSEINDYEVSWGYSDAEGILGLAAGASSISSGWTYTLRQFKPSKWQPSDSAGGKAPIIRYNTRRLWSSLRVDREALDIYGSSLKQEVFAADEISNFALAPLDAMTRAEAQEQHMKVLARRSSDLSLRGLGDRLDTVESSLELALDLFAKIRAENIVLESRYRPRVDNMLDALRNFRSSESL